MRTPVPPDVIEAFGLDGKPVPLTGGRGEAVRVGGVVLKPWGNAAEAAGLAEVLQRLGGGGAGYRVASPRRAPDGRWVVDGWIGSAFAEGEPGIAGREAEAVAACRAFHAALGEAYPHRDPPAWIQHLDDPWKRADAIAWGNREPADFLGPAAAQRLAPLLALRRPVPGLRPQIVHGDPGGGNMLFHPGRPPALIDMPPYWRPAGFALAVLLADAVAWEGSPVSVLEIAGGEPHFAQLVLRAVVYRVAVPAQTDRDDALTAELNAYRPVIDWLAR